MDCHSATTTLDPIENATRQVYRLAAQTWLALQSMEVAPSPRNFELWFKYLSGENAQLNERMQQLVQLGQRPAPALLDHIYSECIATADTPALEEGADEIEDVARETATDLAASRRALNEYGQILSAVGVQLDSSPTLDNLVQTVSLLAGETKRVSEQNRTLEARLSNSANQVQRLRTALAEVREDATTDVLTGLVNRRGFDRRLRRAVSSFKTKDIKVALLIVDIDHFKMFNDTYGHKTGDLVLRFVGRLLAENVKGKDTAARYGGEEFGLILSGADEFSGGRVAEQIRSALNAKRLVNRSNLNQDHGVTISIGVAELQPNETVAALIERADAALYRAKLAGRDRVCLSSRLLDYN